MAHGDEAVTKALLVAGADATLTPAFRARLPKVMITPGRPRAPAVQGGSAGGPLPALRDRALARKLLSICFSLGVGIDNFCMQKKTSF